RMTKVIKGEFKKIKDVKVEDVSLDYDTPLEIFNLEVSRLSRMDNDLFTYEVEVANIQFNSIRDDDSEDEADDDMGYDPSDIKTDDEVELTDEESSDNEDEIAKVFRIDTNIFDNETPIYSAFNEFNYLLKVDPDLLTKDIISELKNEALRNKATMEGFISDDDDESYNESKEICEIHELPVCNVRKYMMIKYSFNNDEEYTAVKEDEYNDLAITR
ncbi:hypothetical protein Tco_1460934, partial [Tanacetum coccineum]